MRFPFTGAHGRHAANSNISSVQRKPGEPAGPGDTKGRGDRRRFAVIGVAAAAVTMVAGFAAWPASADTTTGEIRGDSASAVADSYIVVFKNTMSSANVGSSADGLAKKYGGRVGHKYSQALHGFEVSISEAKAKRLAANPSVSYVQRNRILRVTGTEPNPPSYGLDRIDQHNLPLDNSYTYPNTASGVHAYIIDTGIRFTHQDFGGRATSGIDTVDNDTDATDCNGHGTHVSGTVGGNTFGVAKGVQLVGVRVLDCTGSGTTAGVVAGVDWVTAHAIKPAVANMSLGGGVDATLDAAVANSIASGVTYGIAAGNDSGGDACNASPARVPAAITVGSTTSTDARSSFSNIGTCVDIFAPGSSITSAWFSSDTATNTISGTSMATPHVVGGAALILGANPALTPQQVRDQMVNNATSGVVTNPGTGSPNKLLFVGGTTTPPTNDFSVSVAPTTASGAAGSSATATVSTATTAGSAQTVGLAASGVPSGTTASFSPTSVSSGGSATLTVATTASTPAGTYPITITGSGTGATHTATFTLMVTGGAGGGCTGTNGTDVAIPDAGPAVFSNLTISGCARSASSTSKAEVHIKHTYRGDLQIDLVAPDGTAYRLKSSNPSDGTANVDATFTVNLSSEAANGTWRLKVQDVFAVDSGNIDTWTLTL
jgi:subtilisin family serine protease